MKKILVLSVEHINPIALRALPLKQGKFYSDGVEDKGKRIKLDFIYPKEKLPCFRGAGRRPEGLKGVYDLSNRRI